MANTSPDNKLKLLHGRVMNEAIEDAMRQLQVLLKDRNLSALTPETYLDYLCYASEVMMGARPAANASYEPVLVFLKSYSGDVYGRSEDLQTINGTGIKYGDKFAERINQIEWNCSPPQVRHMLSRRRIEALYSLHDKSPEAAFSQLLHGLESACMDEGFVRKPCARAEDTIGILSLACRVPDYARVIDADKLADRLSPLVDALKIKQGALTVRTLRQLKDFKQMEQNLFWDDEQAARWAQGISPKASSVVPETRFEMAAGIFMLHHNYASVCFPKEASDQLEMLKNAMLKMPWSDTTREFEIQGISRIAEKAFIEGNHSLALKAFEMISYLAKERIADASRKTESDFFLDIRNSKRDLVVKSYLISEFMQAQIHQSAGRLLKSGGHFANLVSSLTEADNEELRMQVYLRTAVDFHLKALAVTCRHFLSREDSPPHLAKLFSAFQMAASFWEDSEKGEFLNAGAVLIRTLNKDNRVDDARIFAELLNKAFKLYRHIVKENSDYPIQDSSIKDIAGANLKAVHLSDFPQVPTLHLFRIY